MPPIKHLICHKCGTTKTKYWYRDYDSKGDWNGKRICYECKLEVERKKNRKIKEDRIKDRKCIRCGNIDTYINSKDYECWARYYNQDGKWDGKSYLCHLCNQRIKQEEISKVIKRINEQRLKERKCAICGNIDTSHWYKLYDEKGYKTNLWLCHGCYEKDYNKRPDSHNSIRKIMSLCRSGRVIDFNKFDELLENEKGRIGEDIVSVTLGIKNQNDMADNYKYPYDLVCHPGYGRIQVKIAGFDIKNQSYDFTIGMEHEFDTLIALCMDKERPWKDVDEVYIMPEECDELYGESYISIYRDSSGSKWKKFRIDEKPYNSTYHNMDIYKKFFNL